MRLHTRRTMSHLMNMQCLFTPVAPLERSDTHSESAFSDFHQFFVVPSPKESSAHTGYWRHRFATSLAKISGCVIHHLSVNNGRWQRWPKPGSGRWPTVFCTCFRCTMCMESSMCDPFVQISSKFPWVTSLIRCCCVLYGRERSAISCPLETVLSNLIALLFFSLKWFVLHVELCFEKDLTPLKC